MNFKRNMLLIPMLAAVAVSSFPAAMNCCTMTADAASAVPGDINNDGTVDSSDASLILRYYTYLMNPDGTDYTLEQFLESENGGDVSSVVSVKGFGDINGDSAVDSADASVLLQYYTYLMNPDGTDLSLDEFIKKSDAPEGDIKLATGGEVFTIVTTLKPETQYLTDAWYSSSGDPAKAKTDIISLSGDRSEISEEVHRLLESGEDIDLFIIEPGVMDAFTDDDKLTADITDLGFTENDFANVYDYTKDFDFDADGTRKAVTFGVSPGAFIYRTDFAKTYLGVDSPDEMQALISDWDKFADTSQKFVKAANTPAAKFDFADSFESIWLAHSGGRTSPYVTDGKINITSYESDFAGAMKKLYLSNALPPACQWGTGWTETLAGAGNVMGYFCSPWFIEYMGQTMTKEDTFGNWAVCQGPSSFYWGGTAFAVPPTTDNADDAASFIRYFVTDTETAGEFYKMKQYYLPNNTKAVAELSDKYDSIDGYANRITGDQDYIAVFDKNAKALRTQGVYTDYDDTIDLYLAKEIAKSCLTDKKTFAETAEDAAAAVKEIYPELN